MRADLRLALCLAVLAAAPSADAAELEPIEVAVRGAPAAAPLPAVLRHEVRAFGPPAPPLREPASDPSGRPTLVTQQSIGCVLLGTGMTGLTMLAGAENLVQIVGGGRVVALNPQVLALGVVAVTFGTFCAVGAALTPLYLHLTRDPAPPPPGEPPAPPQGEPPSHMAVPLAPGLRG